MSVFESDPQFSSESPHQQSESQHPMTEEELGYSKSSFDSHLKERKFWKASEWRTFVFYDLVTLRGILPDTYLKHFFIQSVQSYG